MVINIPKQDLIDYYITMKLSSYKIGKIYNCDHKTILNKMVEYNIPRRLNCGHNHSEETKKKISESRKGMKFTEEHKKNISKSLIGNQRSWKGDDVGYNAIHIRIRKHKPKPECCEICGKSNKLELSCKDHKYSRNPEDYQYICRKCHRLFDKCMKK